MRAAGVHDLSTLVEHRRRMWSELREYSRRDLDLHDIVYRRWMRRLMTRGRFLAWIVEDGDRQPAGSGGLWLMPSQPRPGLLGRGEVPYILSMFTEPSFRRQGVASRIVREMVRWSKAHRYGRVILHASRFGRPVYERLGFAPSSEMRLELAELPRERRPSGPASVGAAVSGSPRSAAIGRRGAGSGPRRSPRGPRRRRRT